MNSKDKKVYENPQYKTVASKPPKPDTGFSKIYPKDDGCWYTLDSLGYEKTIDGEVIRVGTGDCSTYRIDNGNESAGNYSTVSGGVYNKSNQLGNTIGGGVGNITNTQYSTIGGGYSNIDETDRSSGYTTIGGGFENKVSSNGATIGGGLINSSQSPASTIGGGELNVINSFNISSFTDPTPGPMFRGSTGHGTIGGGCYNKINGDYVTIGGGYCNIVFDDRGGSGTAYNNAGTIGGGSNNNIFHALPSTLTQANIEDLARYCIVPKAYGYNSILGGSCNISGFEVQNFSTFTYRPDCCTEKLFPLWDGSSGFSTIGGGCGNISSNIGSTIGGGENNVASGILSTVSGGGGTSGLGNEAKGSYSVISGGGDNKISPENPDNLSTHKGEIMISCLRENFGSFNVISGGKSNKIKSQVFGSTIGGGTYNTIDSTDSVIIGGKRNEITEDHTGAMIGGNGIKSVQENTFHVNNLSIYDNPGLDQDNTNVLVRSDNKIISTRSIGGYFVDLENSRTANTNQRISLIAEEGVGVLASRGKRSFTQESLSPGDTYQFLMSGILRIKQSTTALTIWIWLGDSLINQIIIPFNSDGFNSFPWGLELEWYDACWKLSGEYTVKRIGGPGSGKPIISNAEFKLMSIDPGPVSKTRNSGEIFIGGMDNRFSPLPSPQSEEIVFNIEASWEDEQNNRSNEGEIYSTSFVLNKIY